MIDARDVLIDVFERNGFKCDRRLCRRTLNGVTQLALIDRSRFAPLYVIQVGALHPSVPGADLKSPVTWHVHNPYAERLYILNTRQTDKRYIDDALDNSVGLADAEREKRLNGFAQFIEDSFFAKFSTPEQIEEYAEHPSIPEISCSVSLQKFVNKNE